MRDVNLERVGAELFGWTILLVAAVMAADWIVANRFYAPRDGLADGASPAEEFAAAAVEAGGAGPAVPRPSTMPGRAAGEPPPLPATVEQEAGA